MINLIIDIGNTKIKFFIVNNGSIIDSFSNYFAIKNNSNIHNLYKTDEINKLKILLSKYKLSYCFISSVNDSFENLTIIYSFLEKYFKDRILTFNHKMKLPISVLYESKNTVGLDRLAAVSGASVLLPQKNILVIDVGTAITYDILNENNEYLGGNISLGINLRYLALNKFTNKLPLLSKTGEKFTKNNFFAKNTENAIHFGVENGVYYEVEANIYYFNNIFNNLNVVFCGGDAFFFENMFKKSIFAEKNLVAIGLNKILELNV